MPLPELIESKVNPNEKYTWEQFFDKYQMQLIIDEYQKMIDEFEDYFRLYPLKDFVYEEKYDELRQELKSLYPSSKLLLPSLFWVK